MGEHASGDAPLDDRKQSMDHHSYIERVVAPTGFRWWDPMFAPIPCGLSEVWGGRVCHLFDDLSEFYGVHHPVLSPPYA
jgi:hypothetical protein